MLNRSSIVIVRRILSASLLAVFAITGCHSEETAPHKYFSRQYLRAAEAIDAGDEVRLRDAVANIDVNARGRKDMTLLWYAIIRKNHAAIRDLVSAGYLVDEGGTEALETPLEAVLESDNPDFLRAMLDGGLSPNLQQPDGTTLIQRAMFSDDALSYIRLLVERGADVNLADSLGAPALYSATTVINPDVGIFLVEHGADVNATLKTGVSVAYAVQTSIDDLSAHEPQGPITDYSVDDSGKIVAIDRILPPPAISPRGQELLRKFEQLRAMMIARGARFPPDPPEQVRKRMQQR